MPKILIADSLYPDFLKTVPFNPDGTYAEELKKVMDWQFGTSDFYSRNLSPLGWTTMDVLTNNDPLQELWNRENGTRGRALGHQIDQFQPDVLLLQDLSITWESRHKPKIIAAQCSCRLPEIELVKRCDIIFSSFKFYVPKFAEIGVKCVYLPLAFEPSVLAGEQPARDIDISFVGGLGRDLYWKQGTDTMEAVAAAFGSRFHWYGYGLEYLSQDSPLRACYKGEAWGKTMYSIYQRSKVVVNRHGEITQGMTNNLRCYEATGCGALLVTEHSRNLEELFDFSFEVVGYDAVPNAELGIKAGDAVRRINLLLDMWNSYNMPKAIAAAGQARTLRDHTYQSRMRTVSDTLKGML